MKRQEISDQHVTELSGADASGYWWYAVRQAHVEGLLRSALSGRPMDYLDLGCGAGGVLAALTASMTPRQSLGLDGTQQAVDIAVTRGLPARYADFRAPLELPFAPNAVTCLDVLEHLEDPVLALKHLREASSADAVLVLTVPAMPSLFSTWDEVCGHFRRYTPGLLREHLAAGGWRSTRVRHAFSYCVPPAWWQRRVTRAVQEMEFPPVSPWMNRLLTWAGALERGLGSPLPFGTSLVALACPAKG
ncbi:MAG: hypothetical protein DRQ55_08835 [Planctomycetota bacterium]|nr:MAG: hypothetical protein DRQ55_08835 [Planctomycetota bacterium]